jgi:N-acetyl-anhydromuramyl-L-alanine amidase AmpD
MKTLIAMMALGIGVAMAEVKDRPTTTCIVIHHSATDVGSAEAFRRFHVEVNGWEDIGYHFVITNGNGGPDGEIQIGRPIQKVGAHAPGRNQVSIGICLVGNSAFTEKQKNALVSYLAQLCRMYKLTPTEETIQGHHEECPGKGLDLGEIIAEVKKKM